MATVWQIGDIAYIPKFPLSFYSKIGDTDFWKVGIIIDLHDEWAFLFYDDKIEKVKTGIIEPLSIQQHN